MDTALAYTVLLKARLGITSSRQELYLKENDWGKGLLKLDELQKNVLPSSFIDFCLNSDDKQAHNTGEVIFNLKTKNLKDINTFSKKNFGMNVKINNSPLTLSLN